MNTKESTKSKIISVLGNDDRIWNEDKTELNQTLLFDLLDKIDENIMDTNQMYVNKTEMADKKYGISKEDQKLTEEFYKE
ncbi:MAG TPA: hypothetical protein ENN33_07300 [Ignavibacteria bacterium]|nr:hypothetical protein [Ignavibacteria bacterium]